MLSGAHPSSSFGRRLGLVLRRRGARRSAVAALVMLLAAAPGMPSAADAVEEGAEPMSCHGPGAEAAMPVHETPAPSTRAMASRLASIVETFDPSTNVILNGPRADLYEKRYKEEEDPDEKLKLGRLWGEELLNAGHTQRAIEVLQEVLEAARSSEDALDASHAKPKIQRSLAVAYLRQGEQDNCIQGHTAESCLLPISGAGIHKVQRGSKAAAQELQQLLTFDQRNLELAWLLNIAHMTLGSYPHGVPAKWRIQPSHFESDEKFPRFTDVAPAAGVAAIGLAGGSIAEDFNGDGLLDVMVSSWGPSDPLRYFQAKGDGTFEERTEAAGLEGLIGGLNLIQTDFDNDGHTDAMVLRGAWLGIFEQGNVPNSLLRNRGDGTFEDVTAAAGLDSEHPTQTADWADVDADGDLDLFIGNESFGPPDAPTFHLCELYLNNGDGTFTEAAGPAGVAAPGFVKGATFGDIDNDGLPDLYLSRFGMPNVMYRNLGPGEDGIPRFEDITASAGVAEPKMSFATWFFDYDNDGFEDLLVAPFLGFVANSLPTIAADYLGLPQKGEQPRLYRNLGNGRFEDATVLSGLARPLLAMAANFGDLDGDGYMDAYFGTGEPALSTLVPNRMFRNDRGVFRDITTAGGFGHLQKGHGIAFADFDNDGDQDVYAVLGGAYSGDVYQNALFENPGIENSTITLFLQGTSAPRSAIGSRIEVQVKRPNGSSRSIYATVGSGGTFGASPLRQNIGLGDAESVESITVTWSGGGSAEIFTGAEPGGAYRIHQGIGIALPEDLPRYTFPRGDAPGAHDEHHHHHAPSQHQQVAAAESHEE
ncbi:MAG: FG-GAP-like repeat-containing protein [Acidobacteriota bacterium]